jgi:hypothetical protein
VISGLGRAAKKLLKKHTRLENTIPEAPGDLWPRQGLDLTFQMQLLPLLPRGRLAEETWLYPVLTWGICVLHQKNIKGKVSQDMPPDNRPQGFKLAFPMPFLLPCLSGGQFADKTRHNTAFYSTKV